nr:unnamed protein product [Callosobruchus analis]
MFTLFLKTLRSKPRIAKLIRSDRRWQRMSLLLSTRYTCDQCGRSYKHKTNLCNHKREECGKPPSYFCPVCRKGFKKKQHLQRHLVVHQESEFINANVDQETLKSLMTNSTSAHHGAPKIENMVIYPSLPPLSTFPNPVFRMPYVNEASAYLSMMGNRMGKQDQQEGSYLGGMMGNTAAEQQQSRVTLYASTFQEYTQLKNFVHENVRYGCAKCKKTYLQKKTLGRHIRFDCGKSPTFACTICHKKFKHGYILLKHMRHTHEIHIQKLRQRQKMEEEGEEIIVRGRYHCDVCGRQYLRIFTLTRHKKYECGKEPEFTCPVCGSRHKHNFDLKKHMRKVHGSYSPPGFRPFLNYRRYEVMGNDIRINSNVLYSCPRCPKMYKGKYTLARHLRLECGKSPTHKCEVCGQMFIHKHRLISHIKSLHSEYLDVEGCNKIYHHKKTLSRHIRQECGIEPEFQCPHCPYRARRAYVLNSHIKGHEFYLNNVLETVSEDWATIQVIYTDTEQDSILAGEDTVVSMQNITKTDTIEQEIIADTKENLSERAPLVVSVKSLGFVCPTCKKMYNAKRNLLRHMNQECGKEPKYGCTHCSYKNYRRNEIMKHIRKKHPEVQTCDLCKKTYRSDVSLNYHKRMVCSATVSFFCNQCSFATKYKHCFRNHMKTMHLIDLNKAQVDTQDLRINTANRDNSWDNWPSQFVLPMMLMRENMKQSMLQTLGPCSLDLSLASRGRSRMSQESPGGGFVCADCGRTYKLKSSLRNHQKWECGKEPQFKCPHCVYKAKQKMHMARHLERMHRELDFSGIKDEVKTEMRGDDDDSQPKEESSKEENMLAGNVGNVIHLEAI